MSKLTSNDLDRIFSTTKVSVDIDISKYPVLKLKIADYVAQQNAALIDELLSHGETQGRIGLDGIRIDTVYIPASILEAKRKELEKQV